MTTSAGGCQLHRPRWRFRYNLRSGGQVVKCFRHAVAHRPTVRTAAATAAVVGTVLTAIKQGNLIAAGDFKGDMGWKIPLTYCVPYCVFTWSALRTAFVR